MKTLDGKEITVGMQLYWESSDKRTSNGMEVVGLNPVDKSPLCDIDYPGGPHEAPMEFGVFSTKKSMHDKYTMEQIVKYVDNYFPANPPFSDMMTQCYNDDIVPLFEQYGK